MSHSLGVDPGKTKGAAVLLDEKGKVVLAYEWRELTHNYAVTVPSGQEFRLASLHAVGTYIADAAAGETRLYDLVVEGLFVGPSPKGSMTLAEATGEVMGPMRTHAFRIRRPLANNRNGKGWRQTMLSRKSPGGAKGWADLAIQMAQPVWGGSLGVLSGNEHACEAAWMALWGQRVRGTR